MPGSIQTSQPINVANAVWTKYLATSYAWYIYFQIGKSNMWSFILHAVTYESPGQSLELSSTQSLWQVMWLLTETAAQKEIVIAYAQNFLS